MKKMIGQIRMISLIGLISFMNPIEVFAGGASPDTVNGWYFVGATNPIDTTFSRIVADTATQGKYSQAFYFALPKANTKISWEKKLDKTYKTTHGLNVDARLNRISPADKSHTAIFQFFIGHGDTLYPTQGGGIDYLFMNQWIEFGFSLHYFGPPPVYFDRLVLKLYWLDSRVVGQAEFFLDSLRLTDRFGNLLSLLDRFGDPEPVPVINISPTAMDFGKVKVGTSLKKNFVVSNTGTANLFVSSISSDKPDFWVTEGAIKITNLTVLPGMSKILSVNFLPTVMGAQSANIILVHNARGSPDTVTVTGTGAQAIFSTSPTAIDFGKVRVGETMTKILTIANLGNDTLTVKNLTAPMNFSVMIPLPINIAPGKSFQAHVVFAPQKIGEEKGGIIFDHSAPSSLDTVAVKGVGTEAIFFIPASEIDFGNITLGKQAMDSVVIANTGNDLLTINSLIITNALFTTQTTTPFTIGSKMTATALITFTPQTMGFADGFIIFDHNGKSSPDTVYLHGVGIEGVFEITPDSLTFLVVKGDTGKKEIVITNTGKETLNISTVSAPIEFYLENVPTTLPPQANATVRVFFVPKAFGIKNGTILFSHDGLDSPGKLYVRGVGINLPPVKIKKIGDRKYKEDSGEHVIISNLNSIFKDGNDTLKFSVISLSSEIQVFVRNNIELVAKAENNFYGYGTFIVIASDGMFVAVDSFTVTFTPVNDAPEMFSLKTPADSVTVDSLVVKFVWRKAKDVDGKNLVYTLFIPEADTVTITDTTFVLKGKGVLKGGKAYSWYVTATDDSGAIAKSKETFTFITPKDTSIRSPNKIPSAFALHQNYPNPFNSTTTIRYELPKRAHVKIEIYNVLGQRVVTLVNKTQSAGYYDIRWRNANVSSGMYFYVIRAEKFVEKKKMLLLK